MKIALFGASGMIGQRILHEALQRGHVVTAIVRDPSRLTETHDNLHVVSENALDPVAVAAAVSGHDAVISAISPGHGPELQSMVTAIRSQITGLEAAGVKRLVVVGGAGSLEVAPGVQLVDTGAIPAAWLPLVLDHREALNTLRAEASDLEWTYFSPAAMIQPGERTGNFRLGGDELIKDADGNSHISAEDYAIALLDEVENPKHIRSRFTIGY